MNRRSFLRFLALAPLAVPAAIVATRAWPAGARWFRGFRMSASDAMLIESRTFPCSELWEFSSIGVPAEWIINRAAERQLEAMSS